MGEEPEQSSAFMDMVVPVCIAVAGLTGCLADGYFEDGAVMGLGILVLGFGMYGIAEAALGLVIDTVPRLGGAIVVIGLGVLVYAFFYGYRVLMVE